jgi:hypothetical protein
MDVKIENSWKKVLKDEFTKDYFLQIVTFIKTEKAAGKIIYPPGSLMFNAFDKTHCCPEFATQDFLVVYKSVVTDLQQQYFYLK